jgi:uncharacterized protein
VILYLDTSALVKRYISELGTTEVNSAIQLAEHIGTSVITRAETSAALSKSIRVGSVTSEVATAALHKFREEWTSLIRLQATELLITKADALAWDLGLRGYDAVHLASAVIWQEHMEEPVVLATFDRQLWKAAKIYGLGRFPEDIDITLARA